MRYTPGNYRRERGVTILEILTGLALLVVLLSFAAPSLSGATARAELRAAVENMEFSIRAARTTARQHNTDVIMHIRQERRDQHHSVSFSMPALAREAELGTMLQTFTFPQDIQVVASADDIRFDFRGMVDAPVQLLLVSNQDVDLNQRLLIE